MSKFCLNTADLQSVEEASNDDAQRELKYWASSQIQSESDNSLNDLERSIKWRLDTTQGPAAETYENEVLTAVEEQYLAVVPVPMLDPIQHLTSFYHLDAEEDKQVLKLPIQLIFRSSFWNCLFEARRPGLCIYRPTPRVDNCNANGSLLLRSVTLLQCWNPLREMYIVDTDSPRRKLIRTTPTDMNYRSLSSCTWVLSKSSFLLIS